MYFPVIVRAPFLPLPLISFVLFVCCCKLNRYFLYCPFYLLYYIYVVKIKYVYILFCLWQPGLQIIFFTYRWELFWLSKFLSFTIFVMDSIVTWLAALNIYWCGLPCRLKGTTKHARLLKGSLRSLCYLIPRTIFSIHLSAVSGGEYLLQKPFQMWSPFMEVNCEERQGNTTTTRWGVLVILTIFHEIMLLCNGRHGLRHGECLTSSWLSYIVCDISCLTPTERHKCTRRFLKFYFVGESG